MPRFSHRQLKRSQIGSMGALLIVILVVAQLAFGALALDFAHMLTVKTELQNAADAAALAGALDLSNSPDNAESQALAVAANNKADGREISNQSPNTQVTVLTQQGLDTDPGTCQVDARMTVQHMLAPLFGRQTDEVVVRSVAANYPTIGILDRDQAFPIAVSIDQKPNGKNGQEPSLNDLKIGDDLLIVIRPNGNPGRNAAWTSLNYGSANTNTYRGLMDKALGLPQSTKESYTIPPIEAGVTKIYLDNGLNSGTKLEGDYAVEITNREFITMPVIEGSQYNQKQTVIGFITIKVNHISKSSGDYTVDGTLVKTLVRGWPGESSGNDALAEMTPGVVKLVSASTY